MPITLDHLRRYAVARSLFKPTTLKSAFDRMGFVQADPIRSPARAQDLIMRHRAKDYHAGDLERFAAGSYSPAGGFAWLDDGGRPDPSMPLHTWISCRMTFVLALALLLCGTGILFLTRRRNRRSGA